MRLLHGIIYVVVFVILEILSSLFLSQTAVSQNLVPYIERYTAYLRLLFGANCARRSPQLGDRIALKDAPDAPRRSGANRLSLQQHPAIPTRASRRNSAVHFYYLPFYGRKSLPHADLRCAEGRRAIAGVSKNEQHTAPSYSPRRWAGASTYGLFDTPVLSMKANSVSSLKLHVAF